MQKFFVDKFAQQYGKEIRGITRRAQLRMATYSWPGNIRELENVIGNAAMMAQGSTIDVDDLPEPLRGTTSMSKGVDEDMLSLEEVQNIHVARVLERVGGNKARAAEILGVSRTTIYQMLSKINKDQQPARLGSPKRQSPRMNSSIRPAFLPHKHVDPMGQILRVHEDTFVIVILAMVNLSRRFYKVWGGESYGFAQTSGCGR